MGSVERLHAVVERDGYTQADVEALQMLADAGFDQEVTATALLAARDRRLDPRELAWVMIRRRRA